MNVWKYIYILIYRIRQKITRDRNIDEFMSFLVLVWVDCIVIWIGVCTFLLYVIGLLLGMDLHEYHLLTFVAGAIIILFAEYQCLYRHFCNIKLEVDNLPREKRRMWDVISVLYFIAGAIGLYLVINHI